MTKLSTQQKLILTVIALLCALGAYVISVHGSAIFNVTLTNNTDLNSGLVGHWTFDGPDMQNGVEDTSGNGNNGTLVGFTSTTTAIGKIGQALHFDGVNDYVDVGNPASLQITGDTLTLAAWVKMDSVPGAAEVVTKLNSSSQDAYGMDINSGRVVNRISTDGATVSDVYGNTVLSAGKWYHIVSVYDGSYQYVYVNGQSDVTPAAETGNIYNAASNVFIGAYELGPTINLFPGDIDDVRIYNRALSAAEVTRLYDLGATTHINTTINNASSSLASGLMGHWTFDGPDMIGGVLDTSGRGNNGILQLGSSGNTSTTSVMGKLGQALDFDGVDDDVYLGDNPTDLNFSTTNAFTWGAWVKPVSGGTEGTVFARGGVNTSADGTVYNLWDYLDGTRWQGFVSDGTNRIQITSAGNTVTPDVWQYMNFVWDGSVLSIYKNGESIAASTATTTFTIWDGGGTAVNRYTAIGKDARQSRYYFNGDMDDVRAYNRALSPSEIERLYQLGQTTHINTTPSNASSSLESGLVGHWTFDGPDMIGGVLDTSGNGYNGALSLGTGGDTSTTSVMGKVGQALYFDGIDDKVSVPTETQFQNLTSFTVTGWYKPESFYGFRGIAEVSGLMRVELGFSTNQLIFHTDGWTSPGSWHSPAIFATSTWYQFAVSYNYNDAAGTAPKVYINGTPVTASQAVVESGTFSPPGSVPVTLGSVYISGDRNFKGTLDDMRVYNRVLSANEVKRLYDLGH